MSKPIETPSFPPPERPALTGVSIVLLRLLLLLVAAGAVFSAVGTAFRDRDGDPGARFACPMHPDVRAAAPGQCPICQMALEPLGRGSSLGSNSHGGRPGMADMTAVENVRKHKIIDFVRVRSLLPNLREIRGPAWTETDGQIAAIFYNDQIAVLVPDEPAIFSLTARPEFSVAVARMAGPVVAWDQSTSLIRFRRDADQGVPGSPPQAGQVGWLRIASKSRAVLGVPVTAVLQSPEGPYVLAWTGGQTFEKRSIAIGETFSRQGFAVVLGGLFANDRVVSKATFFLDADRRLGVNGDLGWGSGP